ncbi:MAG: 23S rRNA (guanosine(2251)-2'-O)-methyltransferase RlmB [Bacteroidota bacterium]|nr:23S rRNA (guanosine(2251)-2'-O)-methyltransferase RlmB [Bacteroidota bacterium]
MNFIAGRNPIIEALKAGTLIEKIYIVRGTHGEPINTIRRLARMKNVPCAEVPQELLDQLFQNAQTQGVLAVIGEKKVLTVEEILEIGSKRNEKPFLVIFDEIEDPHNLGALIRSALCVGAHGGIVPKHHAASVSPTVAKTSAGASEHFPVAKVTNIATTIDELKAKNIWVVGTDPRAEKSFTELDYSMPLALVIGNEGRGIRRLVREKCDFLVKIPMAGKFDSFNASVAGALVMYEVYRKRHERLRQTEHDTKNGGQDGGTEKAETAEQNRENS